MNQQECFFLGFVTKPFGYKGEVVLFLDVDEPQNYSRLDAVFIEIKGQLIPFFIEKINTLKGQNLIVRFRDLSVEEAHALIGNKLFLPLASLPKLKGNKFYFHEVLGYTVKDIEKGIVGILEKINEQGPQAIFVIQNEINDCDKQKQSQNAVLSSAEASNCRKNFSDCDKQKQSQNAVLSSAEASNCRKNFKEIMIPIVDEFIVKVDRESKEIIVKAPAGLIDFYLNL